jgi:hypothetical protein
MQYFRKDVSNQLKPFEGHIECLLYSSGSVCLICLYVSKSAVQPATSPYKQSLLCLSLSENAHADAYKVLEPDQTMW